MERSNQTLSAGDQLRLGMRHWASGVGVAAAEFGGTRAGLTVSSFTSVSVDPPMMMISVNKTSYAHDLILKSGKFGVTLLAEDQQYISDRFAGRVDQENDRFDSLETFTLETGSPLIPGGLAAFDCQISGRFDTGSTTVIFGEVIAAVVLAQREDGKRPLLYYDQGYRELAE